jgi:hypothetical protein
MLLDFYPGPFNEFAPVGPRPVDRWLRAQPEQGAVVEFPFDLQTEQIHVYYTLENGKPYLGGFFSAFPPSQFQRVEPIMAGFPSTASLSELEELGVQFALVHSSQYLPTMLARISRNLEGSGWMMAGEFEGIQVYEH